VTIARLTSYEAFMQAGPVCFVKACKARTMFAVSTDDYIFAACGDHLSTAVREAAYQYTPPVERVEVFWRPQLQAPIPRSTRTRGRRHHPIRQ